MPLVLLLIVTASALTILSSAENTQICQTEDGLHGKLFVAQDSTTGTELNILAADLSTSSPSNVNQFTTAATVPNPSSVTLSADGVSDLQHERVVVTSTSIVTLTRDALVIVGSEGGQTVLQPINDGCNPHRLYALNPDDVIYVLCRNKSRVFKLESDSSSGYQLTEIEWKLESGVHVDSPAVAFSNGGHVAAAVLTHDIHDEHSYDFNSIEIRLNIEVADSRVFCVDTYVIDNSCYSAADRLLPFNDTHLIMECAGQQFLLDIFSQDDGCVLNIDITSPDMLQQQAEGTTTVGPDKDTFVVNYGTNVLVQRNHFKQSYVCNAGQQIVRLDYVGADYIILFTATGTLSCNSGVVTNLSPLSISTEFVSYFVEGTHLFIATSSSSTAVTVYDVENACQFQFGPTSSISIPPGPLLFAFVEGAPPTVITTSSRATTTQSVVRTPSVTSLPTVSSTASPNIAVSSPPPTVITTSSRATTTQSVVRTPSVTSLPTVSSTASPNIAASSPPGNMAVYVAMIAAVIISSMVTMAVILTICIVLLCRKCGSSKSNPSPEAPSPTAQSLSTESSMNSLCSAIQETIEHPPIPVSNSQYSISRTIQPPWESSLIAPYQEIRPFLERISVNPITAQNPVPSELYLIEPVPETHGNFQYTYTSSTDV